MMSHHLGNFQTCRRFSIVVVAGIGLLLCGERAWAVKTSGSSFASRNSGAVGSTDTDSHTATNATSASSQSRSDVSSTALNSHAQSWATAKLVGGVLTKTASGKTWVETPGNDAKAGTWYAYSSGTKLQVNGADGQVEMQLVIRQTNSIDPSVDESPFAGSPLPDAHQGVYIDNLGPSTPAGWNFMLDLKSSFSQDAVGSGNLITGNATIARGGTGFDITNQNFQVGSTPGVEILSRVPDSTVGGSPIPRNNFQVTNDISAPFTVMANLDFDVDTRLFTTMGFPRGIGSPTFDVENGAPIEYTPTELAALEANFGTLDRAVGGAGSFIVELRVLSPNYSLNIVPEPSAAFLALMSLGGLGAFRRCWSRRSLSA
jgi:hypothetical protein